MKTQLILLMLVFAAAGSAQTRNYSQKITLKSGKEFKLRLPSKLEIIPAAEGLKRVRFFAKAPDGRIFVTDLFNLTDNRRGAIYILDGWDERTGKFNRVVPYMTGLRNPNSIQFFTDSGGREWLYIAETDKLTRRRFHRGEEQPSDENPETLAVFPDYGLSYKYGGWHLTRTVTFSPRGKLYVSVGSSCNSCREKEKVRASVLEMNPDGTAQREFARGLRNAVGLKWIAGALWASNQGSDHLGTRRPDETFYALRDGADYGWPFCHSANGQIIADPFIRRPEGCRNVTAPDMYFPARSSALGFDYFDASSPIDEMRDSFLVSLHGSTNKSTGSGYKIVSVTKGKAPRDFITGFLRGDVVNGRPCDIMRISDDSFLFTDDRAGVIYLVRPRTQ